MLFLYDEKVHNSIAIFLLLFGGVGRHPLNEMRGLHEHATGTTSRVDDVPVVGFNDIDDSLNE